MRDPLNLDARAPAPKTSCLTMLRYQQMPMVPKAASNNEQRKIVSATPHQSPVQSLPKKIGRPKKPPKVVVKTGDPRKRAAATLSANHTRRIEKQVAEIYKHGPLTVEMLMRQLKFTVRQAAGRKVMEWRKRGLIREYAMPKTGDGRRDMAKWWGLNTCDKSAAKPRTDDDATSG